tara:strand:- start:35 stop:196 length:162 start_codon:yes stop_codon:yes gene_type:complete
MDKLPESIKIINDLVTREVEWADEPTDDIQDSWEIIQDALNSFFTPKGRRKKS